ncbi:MAG: class I SAM-dependent methyltransferase [Verrucomicrobia bacterium]|nr:class I SAM-dependent methyltransferase [Verrucomicrobiota bacterium]
MILLAAGMSAIRAATGPRLSFQLHHTALLDDRAWGDPQRLLATTLAGSGLRVESVVAFEDNSAFAYLAGTASKEGGANDPSVSARLWRRLVLLKPSTFVIDDRIQLSRAEALLGWRLPLQNAAEISGNKAAVVEANGRWDFTTLLPEKVSLRNVAARRQGNAHQLRIEPRRRGGSERFIHVFDFRKSNELRKAATSQLRPTSEGHELTVAFADKTARLWLAPAQTDSSRYIEIVQSDGSSRLERRLLPGGVLPHGPEGARLLERWDSAYRSDGRPAWDTGRPSGELKRLVEDGTLQPCRVIELGCGTGTTSIYLASRGFTVTAADIAPTALRLAEMKAEKSGARVNWLLADVLAMPELRPFDLVFDRGCYHGVRRQNARAYVETLKRLTRPGSRVLILAGNANEPKPHYGPPRVAEEEVRSDFAPWFQFDSLREIRFDVADPQQKGALAWSILMQRTK